MTADIINLRRARKAKERTESRANADANRAKHGRAKSERDAIKRREEQAQRRLDGHRRERGEEEDS